MSLDRSGGASNRTKSPWQMCVLQSIRALRQSTRITVSSRFAESQSCKLSTMNRRNFLVKGCHATLGCSLSLSKSAIAKLSSAAPSSQSSDRPFSILIADLQKQIPQVMKATTVPGVSVAIIKDAQVRWCRGFGVKDAASRQRVDTETIFEAASMRQTGVCLFCDEVV